MQQYRQSDFDVTNTVQVSSREAVCKAVLETLAGAHPDYEFSVLERVYIDFEKLFSGKWPDFLGCDTVYHDIQHTLDMSLATARLITGHELTVHEDLRLGARRAELGIIIALFHDAGYIRNIEDTMTRHGAEFTNSHVSRSADLLRRYLPTVGFEDRAEAAANIVHFTGYEIPFGELELQLDDHSDVLLGHIIGTADMIAQMADRCYLEKCRDRLFPEFVLGKVSAFEGTGESGGPYWSSRDLLRKTPMFVDRIMEERLDSQFGSVYRYAEALYDGRNPYLEAISQSMNYLHHVIDTGNWELLRRDPPCFSWNDDPVRHIQQLADAELKNGTR